MDHQMEYTVKIVYAIEKKNRAFTPIGKNRMWIKGGK